MINGIIFQRDEEKQYRGVEGDNWYLNDMYPDTLGKWFSQNIEKSWFDNDFVDVCNGESFIKKYIELSQRHNISFRMLLCITEKNNPQMDFCFKEKKFIGYDYAYAGGSYYSAVLNDLFLRNIEEFNSISLNPNGLIESIEELKEFALLRKKCIEKYEKKMFENGDFVVYKLYEIFANSFT